VLASVAIDALLRRRRSDDGPPTDVVRHEPVPTAGGRRPIGSTPPLDFG